MKFAIIENGVVVNVAEADEEFGAQQSWVASEVAAIGDLFDPDSGTFTTPSIAATVPDVVTMAQARKALILAGISIASIDAAIAGMADPVARELAATDWEYAANLRRNSDLVTMTSPLLGLSAKQVDDLFVAAGSL
jgi:hypothetical protein